MDVEPSADQRLFRSTTREYLEKAMPLTTVREVAERDAGFPREWWRHGCELGWTAMLVPEDLGGGTISGNGLADLAIVAEEMGRLTSPGPLTSTSAAVAGLAADGGRHADTLAAVVAGELTVSWAVDEPGRGWLPAEPRLRAARTASGWRLDGVKVRVEAADQADAVLVTAATAEGPAQFLVRTAAPGVLVTRSWSLDLTRRFGEVVLADVEVGDDAVVGTPGDARASIEHQADVVAVLQSAETSGAVDRVLEFTVQWATERYTFGRPIGSYQALKHRLADSRMWVEACHAISTAAAREVGVAGPAAAETAGAAASYVGDTAPPIVQDCVQLHGGIGVTWEHDLHLYLRRVTVNRGSWGTPEEHRRRLADLLDAAASGAPPSPAPSTNGHQR